MLHLASAMRFLALRLVALAQIGPCPGLRQNVARVAPTGVACKPMAIGRSPNDVKQSFTIGRALEGPLTRFNGSLGLLEP